jgi:hypothetical protein
MVRNYLKDSTSPFCRHAEELQNNVYPKRKRAIHLSLSSSGTEDKRMAPDETLRRTITVYKKCG